jgi:hypothetical protein
LIAFMQIAKAAADSGPFERNGGWSPPDPDGASPAAYPSTAPSSTRTECARSATQVQAARISSGSETWAIEDPQIQIRQAEVEAASRVARLLHAFNTEYAGPSMFFYEREI